MTLLSTSSLRPPLVAVPGFEQLVFRITEHTVRGHPDKKHVLPRLVLGNQRILLDSLGLVKLPSYILHRFNHEIAEKELFLQAEVQQGGIIIVTRSPVLPLPKTSQAKPTDGLQ